MRIITTILVVTNTGGVPRDILTFLISWAFKIKIMRFLILLLFLQLIVLVRSSHAQDLKPFYLYLTAGSQRALSDGDLGFTITFEPAYRITDRISVGLRVQTGAFTRSIATASKTEPEVSVGSSYTLNGKYYFTDTSFRPYAGMGLGVYNFTSIGGKVTTDSANVTLGAATKFGLYPRVGFDWGRFNLNIDINLVSKTEESIDLTSDILEPVTTRTTTSENNHFAVTVGFYMFGGERG